MPNKLKISQNPDISIIGGGMVGISLALLLSSYKLGWKIQIIDSRSLLAKSNNTLDNRFDRRTTALSQSSYEIYTALGLWEKLNVNASPINEVHISDKGFFGNAKLTAQDQNLPALGYILENQTISDTLLDKAIKIDDIEIIDTAKINKIKPVNGAVELCYSKISEPDEIRNINTKLLIIADGAKSDTRNLLGIESTTKDYGQVAIVSNITLSKDHNNVAYERFTDSGPLAMLPLRKIEGYNRSALVWTVSPAQAQKLAALTEAEFLNELQLAFGFRLGKFTGASRRHSYPVRLTTSKEQVRSNIVIVGNAAHALHPVAGQGFNLALRDIAALADILAKSVTEEKVLGEYRVLENYIKHQKIDQNRTIFLSDFLPTVFGSTSLLIRLARNIGLVALDSIPLLRRNFAKMGMGLHTKAPKINIARTTDSTASDSE